MAALKVTGMSRLCLILIFYDDILYPPRGQHTNCCSSVHNYVAISNHVLARIIKISFNCLIRFNMVYNILQILKLFLVETLLIGRFVLIKMHSGILQIHLLSSKHVYRQKINKFEVFTPFGGYRYTAFLYFFNIKA